MNAAERIDVAVVIPVRNAAAHLGACLASVTPQVEACGAEVVVVDDNSDDDTARVAASYPVRVVVRDATGGPYEARNDGWRSTSADIVVFTDARCRARPGWLPALVAALRDDAVAIAGGDVVMQGSRTLAQRWAVRDQRLRIDQHVRGGFLGFVPTASLAIRRKTLESLGGFRPIRSGGDVDLCWRAQLQGLGSVAAASEAVMDCEPRETVRSVLRQWRRYGAAHVSLWASFREYGCVVPRPDSRRTIVAEALRAIAAAAIRRRDPVELVEALRVLNYRIAYRNAYVRVIGGEAT